jgi:hypothetical protein
MGICGRMESSTTSRMGWELYITGEVGVFCLVGAGGELLPV